MCRNFIYSLSWDRCRHSQLRPQVSFMVLVLGWETFSSRVHLFQRAAVTNDWLIRNCKGLVPTLNLLPSRMVQASFVTGCSWVFHLAEHFCRWLSQERSLVLVQLSTLISVFRALGKDGPEGDLERDAVSYLWWALKTLTPEIAFYFLL